MDDRPRPRPTGTESDYAFLAASASGEPVLDHVEGLGATLVLTATRAIVVRQGAHFRPRNGVRTWPLSDLREVHLAPPRNGNGRVVLRTGTYPWQAVSLFVADQHWPAAERVVAKIRGRLAQARRSTAPDGGSSGDGDHSDPPNRD
jgi:hypothetical protein